MPRVARSAFYRWFDEPLERLMEALAERALAYARAQQVDLAGPLCGVTDWSIVDSTTVKVRDTLKEDFPGDGGRCGHHDPYSPLGRLWGPGPVSC